MSAVASGLAGALMCLTSPPVSVEAQRKIPEDNLAYPVLVQLGTTQESVFRGVGDGSGFYVNAVDATYLVTARHVLFAGRDASSRWVLHAPEARLTSYPKSPQDTGKNVFDVDLARLFQSGDVRPHLVEDLVVVRIGKHVANSTPNRLTVMPGVIVRERASTGILGVALENIKKYDDILVGNEVFIFGYPTSLGLKSTVSAAQFQFDPLRPLLRAGVIAGRNPATRTIILDCAVYPGNSGGPVLEVATKVFEHTFRVIGVVSQFIPMEERSRNMQFLTNSGYAVATPMDSVLDMMK